MGFGAIGAGAGVGPAFRGRPQDSSNNGMLGGGGQGIQQGNFARGYQGGPPGANGMQFARNGPAPAETPVDWFSAEA